MTKKMFNNDYSRVKFFLIFKVALSMMYLVPAFFVGLLGFSIDLLFAVMGTGISKFHTESLIESFKVFANFSAVMIIASVLMMLLSSKAYSKFNHDEYSKKLDLIVCLLLIVMSIFYTVVFYIRNTPLTISMIILTLIQVYNIIVILKFKGLPKK